MTERFIRQTEFDDNQHVLIMWVTGLELYTLCAITIVVTLSFNQRQYQFVNVQTFPLSERGLFLLKQTADTLQL